MSASVHEVGSVPEDKKLESGIFTKEVDVHTTPTYDDEDGLEEFREKSQLRQGLHQRHIQMIALAGTIGTGLFLSSGKAIAHAGPLGALLGYAIVGLLIMGPVFCVAEMSALVPLSGGVIRHAEYFVDSALSFADGWNSVYSAMVSVPAEIVAAAVIVDFWSTINNGVWITILGVLVLLSNIVLVRIYGEIEFAFSILKIMLIVGVNLMALVLVCGGGPNHYVYGAKYWVNPGPFVQYLGIEGSLGRFLGFYTVLINAVYAYNGTEQISIAAAETQSPRRNIPIAARRIFARVAIFYVLSIFFIGLLVPSNDKNLVSGSGNASQSPFVIAATRAGIKAVPSIINAVVLTSAWSAGNSGLLTGARILYGLALEKRAPAVFKRVSKYGIPWVSVAFLSAFMALGYMTLDNTASTVFGWLQDLVSTAALVHWTVICVVYLRFYYAFEKQGISRDRLPYKSAFQPYLGWLGAIGSAFLLLTNGYTVFIHGHWSTETFISSYINIPLFLCLYFGFKMVKKTKIIPLDQVPLLKFIEYAEQNPEDPPHPVTGWRRLNILWN